MRSKSITVKQLITKLLKFPMDAEVVCVDWRGVECSINTKLYGYSSEQTEGIDTVQLDFEEHEDESFF